MDERTRKLLHRSLDTAIASLERHLDPETLILMNGIQLTLSCRNPDGYAMEANVFAVPHNGWNDVDGNINYSEVTETKVLEMAGA
jgi:hypothetical protein